MDLTSSNWSLLGVDFSFLLSSAALVNSADMIAIGLGFWFWEGLCSVDVDQEG